MDGYSLAKVIVLADGTRVRVRPIRPDDALRLQTFVTRLSPRTMYLRTNMHRAPILSDREAAYLTRVDYRSTMALVALVGEEPHDEIVGVARYADSQPVSGQAEVAIVVADAYQKRGIGGQLLTRLVGYARDQSLTSLIGNISAANEPVLCMVRRSGLPAEYRDVGCGEYQVVVTLARRPGMDFFSRLSNRLTWHRRSYLLAAIERVRLEGVVPRGLRRDGDRESAVCPPGRPR